jgi:formate-dependent nitrite reductase membrane component NrfD
MGDNAFFHMPTHIVYNFIPRRLWIIVKLICVEITAFSEKYPNASAKQSTACFLLLCTVIIR